MTRRPVLALCLALAAAPALAGPAELDILPGWRTAEGTQMAAIRVQLDPGWKTYWRAPGDAGIPPEFTWEGSSNLASVAFHWPTPELFATNGMTSIGYHDQLILPVELTPRDPARPIRLRGRADIGVCSDICVPFSADFAADLDGTADHQDARIAASLRAVPTSARAAGVGRVTCTLAPERNGYVLSTSVAMPPAGRGEFAVIELPGLPVWVSEARTTRQGDRLDATVDVVPEPGQPLALDRSKVRITVLAGGNAVEIRGCS
ncbi:protein-disulfide reductase DsbD domain-containing protein [Oceaniglobus roseus]|uniref:protein-disulfide reductase DsbD domain-containing protein n=1 Tax=Oceaniglobus roseus TaxID=1737570 RepID=UPI000C7EBAFA|nr:protein-disulfide reductase DsbD domain-containing protein [Kandeliimicrobium roseum]